MGIASKGQWGPRMVGETVSLNTDPSNRREQLRRTVIKGAKIVFKDRQSTLDCRVRDMSTEGARLDLSTQQLLPHQFELLVAGSPPRRCGLRWARGTFVGVRFLPEAV
jgi:hypothetical protein